MTVAGVLSYTHLAITAILYLTEFFVCGEELIQTTDGAFEFFLAAATFQGCQPEPWMSFIIFLFTGLPWLVIGIYFVVQLALGLLSNPIIGTIAGLSVIALILAFIIF